MALSLVAPGQGYRTPQRSRVFTVTELRRNGEGDWIITPVRFEWDAATQSAPRNSWKFGLKQRSNRTDYTGADEPTEQILGPSFKPFTLEGIWDDRYSQPGYAWDTFQAFEALVARGNLVRIEFEELGVTGLITDFDVEYVRKWYIKYSFTVSPHFREIGGLARSQRPQVPIALQAPEQLIEDLRLPVKAAVDLQDDLPTLPTTTNVVADVLDKLTACVAKVDDATQIVENQFFGPAEQTAKALKRLASQMRSVRGDAQDILTSVAGLAGDTELAYTTAIDVLDFEVWQRGIAYQSRLIIGASKKAEEQYDQRVDSTVKAIYRPHYGESVYAISNFWYNTPDNWRAIVDANGLSYLTLQGNEVLIIPELR